MAKRKGTAQVFLGAASILIIVGIVYVLISLASPALGIEITGAITNLRLAVLGK